MRFFGHPISINAVWRFGKQLNVLFINSLSHVNGTTITPRFKGLLKTKEGVGLVVDKHVESRQLSAGGLWNSKTTGKQKTQKVYYI